jgi:hypothetical protein
LKERCIVSDRDRELLAYNGLGSFESLWNAELDWFEEPNHRRNGWSGVSRHVLKRPDGSCCAVFIKRQQNHNFRSLLHPIKGLPTTHREYKNILCLKRHGVPCPDLVLYGYRSAPGQSQAILITRSMEGYVSLEDGLDVLEKNDVDTRRALLASVAETLSRMHRHYLRHTSLYAKHILVKLGGYGGSDRGAAHEFDSVVIDLEKTRIGFPLFRLAAHDLDQLYRHWRREEGDWDVFMASYLSRMESRFLSKVLANAVLRKARKKIARKSSSPSASEPGCVRENEPASNRHQCHSLSAKKSRSSQQETVC